MDLRIVNERLVIPGLQHTYRLLQISDTHMCPDSPLDSDEVRSEAKASRESWTDADFGMTLEELFLQLVAYGRKNSVDVYVFPGDIVDFLSPGIVEYMKTFLEDQTGVRLYVPGNHETGDDGFLFSAFADDPKLQILELGELRLVGINNAEHMVEDATMDALEAVLNGDKPVILVHHIPLQTPSLIKGIDAFWGGGDTYFRFGGANSDDPRVVRYQTLLQKKTTRLVAVMAGHVHFSHTDTFENGVVQYVSGAGCNGHARLLTICGEETNTNE